MPRTFVQESPARIVFGPGTEAQTAQHLDELGARRVLLVAQGHHREGADRIAASLGERCVGVFDEVRQHVPQDRVDALLKQVDDTGADWVVAHGGGSAIGFAKAAARSRAVRIGAVVTTYSGSERTSIWGITGPEGKQTGRDVRVRPSLVVYDPELTLALPVKLSLESLYNALAHAVEVLWNPEAPGLDDALEAARQALRAAPALAADPDDIDARSEALYAAYLCAATIETAPLALQHLLAHAIGGTFDTPHARTHTVLLPYTMGFNGVAVPRAMALLRDSLGDDPPAALYDQLRDQGLACSLSELGLKRDALSVVADRALDRRYDNPRPLEREALIELLDDTFHARRPSLFSRRRVLAGSGPHAALKATERGAPLDRARAVLICVHGRGAVADRITRDLESHLGEVPRGLCLLAPQALDNTWYPKGFAAPLEENQPFLDSALSMLDAAWQAATEAVPPERVVLAGFSQGACLLLSWARSRSHRPGALLAMSGAALDVPGDFDNLASSRVHLSKSEVDAWIPQDRFDETAAGLAPAAALTIHVEPGEGHAIYEADGRALREVIATALGYT